MSDFLPLRPVGDGGPDIEGFGSFWVRVAHAHSVPLSSLARMLVQWWNRKPGSRPVRIGEATLYHMSGTGLAGYGHGVVDCVAVLAAAIGHPTLHRTTLTSLRAVASPNAAFTFWPSRTWCSACMQEALIQGDPHYDRLAWTLRSIVRCHHHRILLHNSCPSCGEKQRFFSRTGDLSQCYRCSHTLQHPYSRWTPELNPSFGEKGCLELVAALSDGSLDTVAADAFQVFSSELKDLLSPLYFRLIKIAPSSGLKAWSKPTLWTMLKRAHSAGVSIVDVLKDPKAAARAAGDFEFLQYELPHTARPRKPREAVAATKTELRRLINSNPGTAIPSLKELARNLGTTVGFIRHHHGQLVQEYAHRRMKYAAAQRWDAINRVVRELEGTLLDEYRHGRVRSHDDIVDELVRRCGVGKFLARMVLKRMLSRKGRRRSSASTPVQPETMGASSTPS